MRGNRTASLSMVRGENCFKCDLGDAGYVGIYLLQRIERHKGSAVGHHLRGQHDKKPDDIEQIFSINFNFKYLNKPDCLIFDMLFIKELNPTLNKQCDSIRDKLFCLDQFFMVISMFFTFYSLS